MRFAVVALSTCLIATQACPRPGIFGGSPGSSGGQSSEVTLEAAPLEGGAREDRVGVGDSPAPDGRPDATFTAQVAGTVSGLILTVCDDVGTHTTAQWDTIVGQNPLPAGFMHRLGAATWVLGVVNSEGRLLNNGDGSLPEQTFERRTRLRLYASMTESLQPGRLVCLTVLRPDGSRSTARAELR